jgi:DNA-binding Xre family transcriptional regulator
MLVKMKSNAYKQGLRVALNDEFRKKIFQKLLEDYSYKDLVKMFDITHGELYHYKNKRVKTIPLAILEKIVDLIDVPQSELQSNIKYSISSEDLIKQNLESGRTLRHKQLKNWRKDLPIIDELITGNSINIEKWFKAYRKLLETGKRKIEKFEKHDNKIIITYRNFVKSKLKKFTKVLPLKMALDEEFQYFFGLWCGDRAGGGRLGIINKSEALLDFTKHFLEKLYQNPRYELLKSKNANVPSFEFKIDKITEIANMKGAYAVLVYSVNGTLKSFFDYLEENLDRFLDIIPNKNIFFAGLFDAEGNVLFEDGVFRWACKHPIRTKIYAKHLKSLNLFDRYDGSNLVTKNIPVFKKLVLSYLKQEDKIGKASIICGLSGRLDGRFKSILNVIANHNNVTSRELAKLLKLKKAYAQVNFLAKFGYVRRHGYPKGIEIMEKGLKEVM